MTFLVYSGHSARVAIVIVTVVLVISMVTVTFGVCRESDTQAPPTAGYYLRLRTISTKDDMETWKHLSVCFFISCARCVIMRSPSVPKSLEI